MLVALSAMNYNLTDAIMFEATEDTDYRNTSRRVSRTATLDGGCLITDDGYTDADTTMLLRPKQPLSDAELSVLRSLHQNHSLIHVTVPSGVFQGVLSKLQIVAGQASITILCKEKLSA